MNKKIIAYVDAASDLAEGVTADLKNKGTISNETVVHLAKFYRASKAVQMLLDAVERDKSNIN